MKKRYLFISALIVCACNGRMDEMRPHNMAEADSYLNPNRSLETELALFLMTAIRKMWLYIVGS